MKSNPKRRIFWINTIAFVAVFFLILGIASIAIKPEATAFLAWGFTTCCMILVFLMIRNNILKRLKR